MEEILASIRRIISEDDEPAAAEPTAAAAEAEPESSLEVADFPELTPDIEDPADDEVLELTERVESVGDLDVYAADPVPEVEAAPPPVFAAEPEPAPRPEIGLDEGLVGAVAASAAATAFGKLSANIGMGRADQTLEHVVRDLLRPLLKQWLDDNLPGIVQTAVDAEVNRIARGRVG
jgi:uncharacterized protein